MAPRAPCRLSRAAHPAALSLGEVVLDLHAEYRVDAGEAIDHDADQRAVAQPDQRIGRDGVEQGARLVGGEHRRLALRHHIARAAHGVSRVGVEDVAGHQPVKEHA